MRPRFLRITIIVSIAASALGGCGSFRNYSEYRRESPSEYYLYVPEKYTRDSEWSLFIGLHGEDENGADCFQTWQPYADDFGFILLCPTMPEEGGALSTLKGERIIASVLGDLYQQYNVKGRFLLAGYSAGAEFALAYAYRYPGAVSAVSVISAGAFPSIPSQAKEIPVLITVGKLDVERVEPAKSFADAMLSYGYPARLLILEGVDHRLSQDAARVTTEFFKQVSRW
jgi:poly(3-hydroxybutyrate) depolymerase